MKKQENQIKNNQNISQNKQLQNTSQTYIGQHHQAPQIDRLQHIQQGYRINFNNPKKIIKSLFMLHNQSLNIWTHLIGFIFILFIAGYVIFYMNVQYSDEIKSKIHFLESIDKYIHETNYLLVIDELKSNAGLKLTELTQSLLHKYRLVINRAQKEFQQVVNPRFSEFEIYLENKAFQMIEKLKNLESDLEKRALNEITTDIEIFKQYLNTTYVLQFQTQIKHIKNKFIQISDSNSLSFITLGNNFNPNSISKWPLVVFLISAILCLMFSTLFHLFYPMSKKTYQLFCRFDYAGINLLIAGSKFPILYYGLYCKLDLAYVYLAISSFIAVSLFTLSLFQWMHTDKYRVFKASCYAAYGVFGVIPLTHLFINSNFLNTGDPYNYNQAIPFYICMGISYLGGVYIYSIQCPQRHSPGKYDICGHSHQIWHLCVISGIIFTYLANLMNFQERKRSICPI